MEAESAKACLVEILRKAYSGELAAALAYRGHWKSLSRSADRGMEMDRLRQIESDEWVHRTNVRNMLGELGGEADNRREVIGGIIGKALGFLCHFAGWFLPMYFAGKLESANTVEYRTAATYAREAGLEQFADELTVMSVVEREHELFFLEVVSAHFLLGLFAKMFGWGKPGILSAKLTITESAEVGGSCAQQPFLERRIHG